MSDSATLKNEIKIWEREFKAKNGRDPHVQDIKANPAIAAKYKLHKKLGKAPAHAPINLTKEHSGQPKRLLPKARVAETSVAPLTSFNPFSPQKERHTRKPELPTRKIQLSIANPFATPSKAKTRARAFTPELSPDPPSPSGHTSSQPLFAPATTTPNLPSAVARARKRLRGEAVSPSPVKPKRRRLTSEKSPRSPHLHGVANDGDDSDIFADAHNSSFIDDSPVKGTSFKLLFDESQRKATTKQLFPQTSNVDVGGISLRHPSKSYQPSRTKEKLFPSVLPASSSRGISRQNSTDNAQVPLPRKRAFSECEPEASELLPVARGLVLIPPSPPPPDAVKRPTGPFKGKGKATNTKDRKKSKASHSESDEDDDEGSTNIKVVVHNTGSPHADQASEGEDMFLIRPKGVDLASVQASSVDEERLEVDLPDRLMQVLAFSPVDAKSRGHEGKVIDGLIYGRRTEHYDASRGGEIWDIGEQDAGDSAHADGEDWEDEPVPWDVGEL